MVSTEFTDQVEYLAFKDKLRTTLIYVAIAFGIGFVLAFKDGIGTAFFIGFVFAGFPVPWRLLPYNVTGFGFLLKVTLCIMFGLIATPIVLGYYIYQMKTYEKRLQQMPYQQMPNGEANAQYADPNVYQNDQQMQYQSQESADVLFSLVSEGTLDPAVAAQKLGLTIEELVSAMAQRGYYYVG